MGNERERFLAAIRANPHDDLPWLMYADWLDDNSFGEQARHFRNPSSYISTADHWLLYGDVICESYGTREVTITCGTWRGTAELMLRDRWPQVRKWNLLEPPEGDSVIQDRSPTRS